MENGKSGTANKQIVLLNDNYAELGLKAGYVGILEYDLIETLDCIITSFYNPLTGEEIKRLEGIDNGDFRVLTDSPADQNIIETFKNSFVEI